MFCTIQWDLGNKAIALGGDPQAPEKFNGMEVSMKVKRPFRWQYLDTDFKSQSSPMWRPTNDKKWGCKTICAGLYHVSHDILTVYRSWYEVSGVEESTIVYSILYGLFHDIRTGRDGSSCMASPETLHRIGPCGHGNVRKLLGHAGLDEAVKTACSYYYWQTLPCLQGCGQDYKSKCPQLLSGMRLVFVLLWRPFQFHTRQSPEIAGVVKSSELE